ncbi:hypothetical protein Dimus_030253 [Dionaea muscipula]
MASANALRFAMGILGNIIALFLFLSPVPTFIRICKKGSVEQYSPVPYLATFINCMIWVLYGLPFVHPNSILVITINATGCLIEVAYLLLFIVYSKDKKRLRVIVISVTEIILVGVFATAVLTLVHGTKHRSQVVGMVAIVGNIMMYAAPLSVMKLVITTKSVEYMPFSISLASFCNGVAWTVYAIRPFDPYMAGPNGVGTIFSLVQLILYATYYKSTKKQMAERNAKAGIGLAEVVVLSGDQSSKVSNIPNVGGRGAGPP